MRKPIILIIAALAMFIAGLAVAFTPSSASAATGGGQYEPSNVSAELYIDEMGQPVQQSWHYAPTPDDEWAFAPCQPRECGTVAIVTKAKKAHGRNVKVKQVVLRKVAGEQFVGGFYSYSTNGYGHGTYGEWDGKPLPLTYRKKTPTGKMVTYKLVSAYAYLYNPTWGTPPEINEPPMGG